MKQEDNKNQYLIHRLNYMNHNSNGLQFQIHLHYNIMVLVKFDIHKKYKF